MAILGFKLAAIPSDPAAFGVGAGFPIAWTGHEGEVRFTMPEAGWPYQIGLFGSKLTETGTTWFSFAIWDAPTGVPTTLLDSTVAVFPSFAYTNRSAPTRTKPLLMAAQEIAIGVVVGVGGIAMVRATPAPGTFIQHIRTGGGQQVPTDPFAGGGGISSTTDQRGVGLYLEYTPNRAPAAPTDITVEGGSTPGETLTTVLPTFAFQFSDPDQDAGYGEKIQRYAIQVKDAATGIPVWPLSGQSASAQFAATTTEQVAGATIQRAYPGATTGSTALASGGDYTLEIQTQDLAGSWGAWSAPFAFSIAEIGAVSVADGTPAGKIDTVTDAIAYTARWHHPSGTATSHVQVEVMQNGASWRLGAEVAKIVASAAEPGGSFTISAAESGIGELPRGEDFTYRVRAQASGIWTGWSPQKAFSTNAPPLTPVPVSPLDGEQVAAPPVLIALSSDPDGDDIMGADVVWTIQLTRPSPLSALTFQHPTDEMTYNGELSLVSFALDVTDCPNTGTYVWEMLADDLSASAVEADYGKSAWSDPVQFQLEAGPQPTLTLPAATVATVSPLYRMTVANGPSVRYRMVVFLYGTTTRVWDSQEVASESLDVVQPAGYLRNGVTYDLQVTVWNGSNQFGTSQRRAFTVAFTAPDALTSVSADPYSATRDPEPTAVLVVWSPTFLPAAEFVAYIVRRRLDGQDPEQAVVLRSMTNAAQARWWDFHAPPGTGLIYSVSQQRRGGGGAGNPIIEGPQTDVAIQLDLGVVVIASARNPDSERVVLRYEPLSITDSPKQNLASYLTWGSEGLPTVISSPGTQDVQSISGVFESDDYATQAEYEATIKALHTAQEIVCVRTPRGRLFGKLMAFTFTQGSPFEADVVTITVEQTNYVEGER